jgi:RNA polymerase sigma-B factor
MAACSAEITRSSAAARFSEVVSAGNPVLAPPAAPGGPIREDLAGLDDRALLSLVQSLPLASQCRAAACELLVTRYQSLVRSCVRSYRGSPVPTEDLMQVGYLGLLKAIGHFDPAVGAGLAAYARPCISGELKRYFRDKRWALRVDRPVQELVLAVRDATGPLAQQLGRTPVDSDLARHLGVSGDKLRQARQAQLAFQPSSLDAPQADYGTAITLADSLGEEDPRLDHMLGMHAVSAHWGELPRREQQILIMDFGDGLTQAQIGQRLGISQMHVSRLRARALGRLRARLFGPEPRPAPALARRQDPDRQRTMITALGAGPHRYGRGCRPLGRRPSGSE